jgi:amino acid transporter
MAEDGYLHPALGKVSDRFGTPVRSILLSAVLCSALAFFTVPPANRSVCMDADGNFSADHAFVLAIPTQLSQCAQKLSRPGGMFAATMMVITPTLLFVWAMIYSDASSRKWGLLNLASGPIAYLWVCYRRREKAKPQPDEVVTH